MGITAQQLNDSKMKRLAIQQFEHTTQCDPYRLAYLHERARFNYNILPYRKLRAHLSNLFQQSFQRCAPSATQLLLVAFLFRQHSPLTRREKADLYRKYVAPHAAKHSFIPLMSNWFSMSLVATGNLETILKHVCEAPQKAQETRKSRTISPRKSRILLTLATLQRIQAKQLLQKLCNTRSSEEAQQKACKLLQRIPSKKRP